MTFHPEASLPFDHSLAKVSAAEQFDGIAQRKISTEMKTAIASALTRA